MEAGVQIALKAHKPQLVCYLQLFSLLAKLLEMQSRMRGKTEICREKLADIFLPLTNWYTSQPQTGLKAVVLSEQTAAGCASCLTAD